MTNALTRSLILEWSRPCRHPLTAASARPDACVLTLAAGIWLIIIGITQTIQAFQTRKAANTARQTVDEVSSRLASALSD